MTRSNRWTKATTFLSAFLLTSPLFTAAVWAEEKAQRIVSIGGSVTEIIHQLDEADRLIARDSTSLFPEAVTALPDVGYIRRLSPEGVLSVDPDLIVTLDGAGPPEAVTVLKSAGVKFVSLPETYDAAGVVSKIEGVGQALNVEDKAATMSASARSAFSDLAAQTATIEKPQRVLFILSMSGGKILASGVDTAADGILKLAGAQNAIKEFSGYKALSEEAIITAAPDAILMMARGGDHSADADELFAHPAISQTPAAASKALIKMDGLYLLGFGPRTPAAATDLYKALYKAGAAAN
ncbi:MAG: ABC transporter substrate-binding protein [Pseudomonadota bacterium]